jgi:hypothetical protein
VTISRYMWTVQLTIASRKPFEAVAITWDSKGLTTPPNIRRTFVHYKAGQWRYHWSAPFPTGLSKSQVSEDLTLSHMAIAVTYNPQSHSTGTIAWMGMPH